jgi:type III secretion system FlhB-like substrate exporter
MSDERRNFIALPQTIPQDEMASQPILQENISRAEKILRLARRHDIPLRADPAITAALAELEINAPIPAELFRAAAEVLSHLYKINDGAAKPR